MIESHHHSKLRNAATGSCPREAPDLRLALGARAFPSTREEGNLGVKAPTTTLLGPKRLWIIIVNIIIIIIVVVVVVVAVVIITVVIPFFLASSIIFRSPSICTSLTLHASIRNNHSERNSRGGARVWPRLGLSCIIFCTRGKSLPQIIDASWLTRRRSNIPLCFVLLLCVLLLFCFVFSTQMHPVGRTLPALQGFPHKLGKEPQVRRLRTAERCCLLTAYSSYLSSSSCCESDHKIIYHIS